MSADSVSNATRKPRADAERNRLRLLEVARAAFDAEGTGVSLEEIARTAGVGIGTLYRHFPTRDVLVAEVYRNEASKLAEMAMQLSESEPPLEALRHWLLLFVDYLATKLILADALRTMVGEGASQLTASSGEQLGSAVNMLVERAVEGGDVVAGSIDPKDLLRAIGGVALGGAGPEWPTAARRMVEILIAGMARS